MSLILLFLACTSSSDEPIVIVETPEDGTGVVDSADTSTVIGQDDDDDTSPTGEVWAEDVGYSSGYHDGFGGNWKRGRAAVVFDVDGDGDFDEFHGNPGDVSHILMNVSTPEQIRFEQGQILGDGPVMWGGTAGDFDNDGDQDLYVTIGGNERDGDGLDFLFRNDNGVLVDISEGAGVWATDAQGAPLIGYHASAFFWDMDRDGRLDLFSNHHVTPGARVSSLVRSDAYGINQWSRNNGDGTFTNIAADIRMWNQWSTRSSTAFDFDNDGDMDFYENNWIGPNYLWKNLLVEIGELRFEDVTEEMSLGGGNLSFPGDRGPQAAIPADLNQDGWEDLFVFRRDDKTPGEPASHPVGHLIWINMEGNGFVEVADHTNINVDYQAERAHYGIGVMGCQLGDLNGDGIRDAFAGNGSPEEGEDDDLMVSTGTKTVTIDGVGEVVVPTYESWSHHVNAPSPAEALRHDDFEDGTYPYRTHGTVFADFDGDGLYEIGAHNGGPFWGEDEQQQSPNQLWKFHFAEPPHYLRLDLHGDGANVPSDPIGARVRALVSGPDGERWVYETMRSATGFGAQNDRDVFLGLADATSVSELYVRWMDGKEQQVQVDGIDRTLRVDYAP